MKVTVIGAAGGIGQPLSLLLKTGLPSGVRLSLYDVVPSTPGVAMDLSHVPTDVSISGWTGEDLPKALEGADVVMICAGLARKPGMTREDLLQKNADIVAGLIRAFANYCPKAMLLVGTNPVNTIVPLAARILEKAGCYDPRRLLGATMLDTVRAESFIFEKTGAAPDSYHVPMICGHSDNTIVPLLSKLSMLADKPGLRHEISEHICKAGTEVVQAKAGAGSATLSMAFASCRTLLAMVQGLSGSSDAIVNSFVDHERFGVRFFAQQVRFGKQGIEEFLPLPELDAYEQELLSSALPYLAKDVEAAATITI